MSFLSRIAKASPVQISPGAGAFISGTGQIPDLKPTPYNEVGVSGLLRTKGTGFVFDEWLASLSTYRARQVYREMRDNDATIGSMFFALEMTLRSADWFVDPADDSPEAEKYAKFIRGCMDDMSHPWTSFISEIQNMFAFGFALFETTYKKRQGPNGKKASKFDDGLIGWRKIAPRAQETILYWMFDEKGGVQGAVQLAAPDYNTVPIPIESLLLFNTTSLKNNPEGRSLLRNAYRSWTFKKRLEEVEGIGIERDICGYPVIYATAEAQRLFPGGYAGLQKQVRNVRVDDQMGMVLPQAFDEKGNRQLSFELIKSAGTKNTDVNAAIARYNNDILGCILAGFIQLGTRQDAGGSRALHMSAVQIFAQAISGYLVSIADVFNRVAIPRLMAMNSMDIALAPKLKPGDIQTRDLDEIATFILNLSQAGLSFTDSDTETALRKLAKLPERAGQDLPDLSAGDEAQDDDAIPQNGQQPPNGVPPNPKVRRQTSHQPNDVSTRTPGAAPNASQQGGDRLEHAV